MEDNSRKVPLLTVSIDPPSEARKIDISKRRFRRCRSAPSPDVSPGQNNSGCGLDTGPKSIFDELRPNLKQIVVFLALYLVISTLCIYLVGDQMKGEKTAGTLDALYFSIVTMTTVGYGDLVPNSTLSKLLACTSVFTGMAIVGLLLSKAADYFAERQEELLVKAFHIRSKANEVDILHEIRTNKVKYKLLVTTICLVLLMVVGTLFLWKVEELSLVDSFYCVCSTITTLGYGDKSFSTEGGRMFAIFWILTSTICVAQFFLYIAEFGAERRQQSLTKWVLKRRMTYVDLQAADLNDDGIVGAAEFIIYKLKELGKISQEDVAAVVEEFEDLDVDQSGSLTPADLVLAQSGR